MIGTPLMITVAMNNLPAIVVIILGAVLPALMIYINNWNPEPTIVVFFLYLTYLSLAYEVMVPAMWAVIVLMIMYVVWSYGSDIL